MRAILRNIWPRISDEARGWSDFRVRWSPDRRHAVVFAFEGEFHMMAADYSVWLIRRDGSLLCRASPFLTFVPEAVWSANSRYAAFRGPDLVVVWDTRLHRYSPVRVKRAYLCSLSMSGGRKLRITRRTGGRGKERDLDGGSWYLVERLGSSAPALCRPGRAQTGSTT